MIKYPSNGTKKLLKKYRYVMLESHLQWQKITKFLKQKKLPVNVESEHWHKNLHENIPPAHQRVV